MKIFKQRGFSLAEMLIAMGIASTIIFLGFTMSKKSIENAYKGYIYTGYHGISTAIKEAKVEEIELNHNDSTVFAKYIADILDADMIDVLGYYEITAPNKIKYIIKGSAISWEGTTSNPDFVYIIKMQTPTKKQQGKTYETICLAYNPDKYDVLLPFDNIPDVCQSTIDISTRPDYLLFYLDDGTAGKTIQGNYIQIEYMSVKDAVCKKNKDITVNYIKPGTGQVKTQTIYDCNDSEAKDTTSIIKYANPLKRLAK